MSNQLELNLNQDKSYSFENEFWCFKFKNEDDDSLAVKFPGYKNDSYIFGLII